MYVFLTGAPGSGKSSVAPHLARLLGARVVELDGLIEQRAQRTIAQIFARDGERAFRALEREALAALPEDFAWTIVSTGGGAGSGATTASSRWAGARSAISAASRRRRSRAASAGSSCRRRSSRWSTRRSAA